jgi:hypothetical protein
LSTVLVEDIKIVDLDVSIIKRFTKLSDILIENWFINEGRKVVDEFLENKSKSLTLFCEFNLEMVSYLNRSLKLNNSLTYLCLYGKPLFNNEGNLFDKST